MDSIGQGHFYSGQRALGLGLVDRLGGLWDALRIAKASAHIAPGARVDLVEGPSLGLVNPEPFQPKLLGSAVAVVARALGTGNGDHDGAASGSAAFGTLYGDAALDAPLLDPSLPLSAAERAFVRALAHADGRPLAIMEPIEVRDGIDAP